jgi:hypothetical protein
MMKLLLAIAEEMKTHVIKGDQGWRHYSRDEDPGEK